MKVHHSIESFKNTEPTVITIGTFDGVHIGHQEILKQLVREAKASHLKSVVLTFFPHPRMVLQKDMGIKLINTIEERVQFLSKTNIDHLIIHPFSKEFSRLSAYDYVNDILVKKLHVKKIIIGYDHRFGKNRDADINDLVKYGQEFDFEVIEISAQQLEEVSVSSTKIRKALNEGNIEQANNYLGYPFMLNGTVVYGKGIGKTLNFPTANLQIDEDYKLTPANGIYIVQSLINNQPVYGITSIGTNPTVGGTKRSIETFFLDFNAHLYNKKLELRFLKKIRDEQKFESVETLQKAIESDEQFARNYLKNNA